MEAGRYIRSRGSVNQKKKKKRGSMNLKNGQGSENSDEC